LSRAKHQHWVPQFYLRYFATADTRHSDAPKVWIFSKNAEDGDEKLTSVRNVCGQRYLYSPRLASGDRDWALEDRLNNVENLLGAIWSDLATSFLDLADEHLRKALALFVAVTHMRHPATRLQLMKLHGDLVALYETGPMHPDGTPDVDSVEINGKLFELDRTGWHDFRNQGKDGHDRAFAKAVRSEAGKMAKVLLGKRWSVLCSENEAFVTSDKPVALSHLERQRFGYGTQGVIVSLPLSPTRLLVMDDRHSEPANQYYPLDSRTAGDINLTTWRAATRFLITGRPVPDVLAELVALEDGS
jgi:hypothetical protein